jgi:hypothetical protein
MVREGAGDPLTITPEPWSERPHTGRPVRRIAWAAGAGVSPVGAAAMLPALPGRA